MFHLTREHIEIACAAMPSSEASDALRRVLYSVAMDLVRSDEEGCAPINCVVAMHVSPFRPNVICDAIKQFTGNVAVCSSVASKSSEQYRFIAAGWNPIGK